MMGTIADFIDIVRNGAKYREALRRIVGQGRHMSRSDAGEWAREIAEAAFQNIGPWASNPTPALRNLVQEHSDRFGK